MRSLVALLAFLAVAWAGICLADEELNQHEIAMANLASANIETAEQAMRAAKAEAELTWMKIRAAHQMANDDKIDLKTSKIIRAPKPAPKPVAKTEPKK